jgi:hypothetical protein
MKVLEIIPLLPSMKPARDGCDQILHRRHLNDLSTGTTAATRRAMKSMS